MAFGRLITVISGPAGETGTSFSDCKIEFDIEKNLSKTSNKATVKLYNLSEATMIKMGVRTNKLIIKAGYKDENNLAAVFYGDINKSAVEKNPPETLLTIEAQDGLAGVKNKTINKSYNPGTQIATVVDDIVSALGYAIGGTKPSLSGGLPNGYVVSGFAKNALSTILKKVGYTWTIQNEQLYIYQPGTTVKSHALKLTPETGLINIARLEQDETAKSIKKGTAGTNYSIKTLLFPQMIPGAIIYVESSLTKGNMIIQSIKMTGSNFDGDFKVEAEVKAV